jgi:hypothetical protein
MSGSDRLGSAATHFPPARRQGGETSCSKHKCKPKRCWFGPSNIGNPANAHETPCGCRGGTMKRVCYEMIANRATIATSHRCIAVRTPGAKLTGFPLVRACNAIWLPPWRAESQACCRRGSARFFCRKISHNCSKDFVSRNVSSRQSTAPVMRLRVRSKDSSRRLSKRLRAHPMPKASRRNDPAA